MSSRDFFSFTSPQKTIAGYSALEQLPVLLESLGLSRPLLITDRGVRNAGLVELTASVMKSKTGISFAAEFDEVPTDSDIETIREIAPLYHSCSCDCIIAVGGGSVIDTAKGVNLLVSGEADDLHAFLGADIISGQLKPLIAVPTTSGTGSEATIVAVIKDTKRKRKLAFTSSSLVPTAAVLDPRMTLTLPGHITAATGMDALTHAMEAYIGLAKNPYSDSCSLRAVELIAQYLPGVMKEPHDREARLQMSIASHLAGIAFSNSMVTMVHTIGHCIGAVCKIPHGVCMSILLPYGLAYNMHRSNTQIGELLLPLAGPELYRATAPENRAEQVLASLREFQLSIHELSGKAHPLRFRDILGEDGSPLMTPEHIPVIAREAAGDPAQFYNPEEISENEISHVISAAYWGFNLDRDLVKKGHQG